MIARNLLAGVSNSVWSALIGLAVVPFYLRYLGIEAYGLIAFYVTTQSLLQLLDMGMAPTINREVARCAASGNIQEAGKLLHTLSVIYWGMAIAIALLITVLAPLISKYWLQSKLLSTGTISHAVMLMGVVLACRWPIAIYQGAIIGAHRLAISSLINMVMVTIGSVGAVGVLKFISPTIESFFIWQAFVGLIYAILIRGAAWRIIGRSKAGGFETRHIRKILRFSLGVGAISFAGLVLTQLDKVILSKTVGLVSFGQYMLATMVATSLYILIIPIFNITYPRLSSLAAKQQKDEFLEQYRAGSRLLSILLFPLAMMLALTAKPLIHLWTGNEVLAFDVAPIVSLLLAAYALHGVMHMPYALMLAEGDTDGMLKIYIALIVVIVPLTIMLSIKYGAIGGAWAQLLLFLFYLILGAYVTHKRYLKGYVLEWLFKDVGPPMGVSMVMGALGYAALLIVGNGPYVTILVGVMLWAIATLLCIYPSRSIFSSYWSKFRYQ